MMRQSQPHALTLGALTLCLACRPPADSEGPDPAGASADRAGELEEPKAEEEGAAEEVAAGPPRSLVVLPALTPPDPAGWAFDPGGEMIAARLPSGEGERCGLWWIEGGQFSGWLDDEGPCDNWPTMEPLASADDPSTHRGKFSAAIVGDRLRVSEGQQIILDEPCPGCSWYDAALDPRATMVAAVRGRGEEAAITVFDLGSRQPALELALDHGWSRRAVTGAELLWGSRRLLALLELESMACGYLKENPDDIDESDRKACAEDPNELVGLWSWTELDGEPEDRQFYPDEAVVEELYLAPAGDLLWARVYEERPRDGAARALYGFPTGERWTNLRWEVELEDTAWSDRDQERRSGWQRGPGTVWLSARAYFSDNEADDWSILWRRLELGPEGSFEASELGNADPVEDARWAVWDLRLEPEDDGDRFHSLGHVELYGCYPEWAYEDSRAEEEGMDRCAQHHALLPEGCEVLASSVELGRVLGRCDRELVITANTGDLGDSSDPPKTLLRSRAEPRWQWSRAGLVALTAKGELVVWDAKGEAERLRRSKVEGLVTEAKLATELGVAVIRVGGAVEVLDLAQAQTLARFEGAPSKHVALSPDGELLALSDGREILIYAMSEAGEPLARIAAGKVSGLAFRQDGAVVFSGVDRPLPERAWDPRSGEAREDAQLDAALLERLAAGELDPGWRFAVQPDGWITRSLDGRELYAVAEDLALSDNGLLAGRAWKLDGYNLRFGPDPRDPCLAPDEIGEALAHETLIEDFFAGRPLPTPTVEPETIAAALAARTAPAFDDW